MPIYSWTCVRCGEEVEEILKVSELESFHPLCPSCPSIKMVKNLDIFARTPMRYGDGHAYFDKGLGIEVKNSMHREKVMEERGLVSNADLGRHFEADAIEKQFSEWGEHHQRQSRLDELQAEGVSQDEAYCEVFDTEYLESKYDLDTPIDEPIRKKE